MVTITIITVILHSMGDIVVITEVMVIITAEASDSIQEDMDIMIIMMTVITTTITTEDHLDVVV